jgi:hypothetical protein
MQALTARDNAALTVTPAATSNRCMPSPGDKSKNPRRPLSPAAERALQEAAARRAEADRHATAKVKESGGPSGPEPTRYGDWEKKGLTSDF